MMKNNKYLWSGCVLLGLSAALQIMARLVPGFGQWYSETIYPLLVNTVGRIMNLVPFSVSEMGIYLLICYILAMVVFAIRKKSWKKFAGHLFLIASVLFFLYCTNCGVNYYRTSFAESAGFDVDSYSVEDLKNTCVWLTKEVNEWSSKVQRMDNQVMCLRLDEAVESVRAMENVGRIYPELSGYYPRPKGLLNHWILSVQETTGIYSPFTVEANYNTGMTDYNIPFTACHELSHLRGFMQEEEANFIAFLACLASEEADFQYSGYLLAWIHCTNLLYKTDYDAWEEIRKNLSEDVEADLRANSEFWNKYDGAVAEVADKINDTYLKANGQSDGVESYGRMADLVVAYYRGQG